MEFKMSFASCTGRYHRSAGIPCQDKIHVFRGGNVCCAALADGAGSRENSDVGAECVTDHISRLLCVRFEELLAMENEALARQLIRECLEALEEQEPPIYELASTLLFFAAHRDGRFLAGHLGDGIQILVEEGRCSVFSLPENGNFENETFFTTEDRAEEHLRLKRGLLTVPGALLLMSDGMSCSLYQAGTGTPASGCCTIAAWLRDGEEGVISQALENNMERIFSAHSSDDLSLAVVAWDIEQEELTDGLDARAEPV